MNPIEKAVRDWLEQVVIDLQLCPFAKAPYQKGEVRFVVCEASEEEVINQTLIDECHLLDQQSDIETSLIICSKGLNDFFSYHQFLNWAEQSLKREGWRGIYQIASFHPDYCFAGLEPSDPQNLTNRSPYPILHLLREASLEDILSRYDEPESIPEKNIKTVSTLTTKDKLKLFPYLF